MSVKMRAENSDFYFLQLLLHAVYKLDEEFGVTVH